MSFAAFLRLLAVNFETADRVSPTLAVAAAACGARFLARGSAAQACYAAVSAITLAALFFKQLSGAGVTVATGLEGLAALAAGFILRARDLRWTGIALLLFGVGKLFAWDLRELDTFSRIVAFLGLGLLLVGASWAYARFREQIRKLL